SASSRRRAAGSGAPRAIYASSSSAELLVACALQSALSWRLLGRAAGADSMSMERAMEAGMVSYICTAEAHPANASDGGLGLTIHEAEWAFCPAGQTADHRWSPIARTSLEELARAAMTAARASEVAKAATG